MATSSNMETPIKYCVKCDGMKSSRSLFTCDGCQQKFCGRHVSEHQQELNFQLENIMQKYNLIQQESNQSKPDESILKKVDEWVKESIIKIQKIAEKTRIDFYRWHQSKNDQVKKECNELAKKLSVAHETNDFSEPDLTKWSQILDNLRTELESMTKVDIVEDEYSCIHSIKIEHNIQCSRNGRLQEDLNSMTIKHSGNISNRTNTDQHEVKIVESPKFRRRAPKTGSNTNIIRDSECKQQ